MNEMKILVGAVSHFDDGVRGLVGWDPGKCLIRELVVETEKEVHRLTPLITGIDLIKRIERSIAGNHSFWFQCPFNPPLS
jgi:hypothetical protein